MTSPRVMVRDALCRLIVQKSLVPKTTVTDMGGTSIGATAFTAASSADAGKFRAGGFAYFADGSGEFPCLIDNVVGSTVHLSFQGREDSSGNPITGLVHSHAAGAVVATNLIPTRPNTRGEDATSSMLGNGYPVFRVFVWGSVTKWPETHSVQPTMAVHVIHQLSATQPATSLLQSDLWLMQQDNRAESDLDTLVRELFQNWTLAVDGSSNAEFVEQAMEAMVENQTNVQVPMLEHYLDLIVYGDTRDIDDLS